MQKLFVKKLFQIKEEKIIFKMKMSNANIKSAIERSNSLRSFFINKTSVGNVFKINKEPPVIYDKIGEIDLKSIRDECTGARLMIGSAYSKNTRERHIQRYHHFKNLASAICDAALRIGGPAFLCFLIITANSRNPALRAWQKQF
ncbi:uncharacterized protein LOC106662219 [Cimex lectularius]|uniref:Uncharacterized protein n=1 Tax=Cimex lectularius TaxID=79782 RepID=A0A8I6RE87_CIMLE|nr:uncharacterized protein LOC106662219 [Cimex lectularius]XP_014241600.1 uncharacterized protein LOC106662219 [Cimex lectularius]